MNRSVWFKVAVVAFVILVTLAAVAIEGTANVPVRANVQLNGKQIAAGNYKVSWTGTDNNVQVTFKNGKSDVLTAPAKLVEMKNPSPYTAIVYDQNGKLQEIRFEGKKTSLVFNE